VYVSQGVQKAALQPMAVQGSELPLYVFVTSDVAPTPAAAADINAAAAAAIFRAPPRPKSSFTVGGREASHKQNTKQVHRSGSSANAVYHDTLNLPRSRHESGHRDKSANENREKHQ
jgi:hypothetical protein